jgi:hypothetical protein
MAQPLLLDGHAIGTLAGAGGEAALERLGAALAELNAAEFA